MIIRKLLKLLGFRIEYRCSWGTYDHRYDGADFHAGRPIHSNMRMAPPWATRHIVRATNKAEPISKAIPAMPRAAWARASQVPPRPKSPPPQPSSSQTESHMAYATGGIESLVANDLQAAMTVKHDNFISGNGGDFGGAGATGSWDTSSSSSSSSSCDTSSSDSSSCDSWSTD